MAFGDGTLILSNRPTANGVEVVTAEDAVGWTAVPRLFVQCAPAGASTRAAPTARTSQSAAASGLGRNLVEEIHRTAGWRARCRSRTMCAGACCAAATGPNGPAPGDRRCLNAAATREPRTRAHARSRWRAPPTRCQHHPDGHSILATTPPTEAPALASDPVEQPGVMNELHAR